jgi:arylsulfatase A-like enzyme
MGRQCIRQQVYSNALGSTGPFRGRKRSLYEGGTRVPSFALWGGGTPKPTIPTRGIEHTPLSASDWLPTVAAIAGVPLPPGLKLDGEDMSAVFLRSNTPMYGDRWKGLKCSSGNGATESQEPATTYRPISLSATGRGSIRLPQPSSQAGRSTAGVARNHSAV